MGISSKYKNGLYAVFNINGEEIVAELYYKQVPITVTSFVGLATGRFDGHVTKGGNFFDGLTFHRVVDDFVIQGGDPDGTGRGGPGYRFPDEFDPQLTHSGFGVLSMANAGPGTNGSQFFITLAATPHLDGKHSVFGKVVDGQQIPFEVSEGDIMTSVEIEARGEDAQAFLAAITWESFQVLISEIEEKKNSVSREQQKSILSSLESGDFKKTKDGIYYLVLNEGQGRKIVDGDEVKIHYELTLYDHENILDSSYRRNTPLDLEVGSNTVIKGWELILLELSQGEKIRAIIPPELGYGPQGAGGGIIPPNAFLDFTMEVVSIN